MIREMRIDAGTGEVISQTDLTTEEMLEMQRARTCVCPARFRVALLQAGRLAEAEANIAAAPDPGIAILWEYSTEIRRTGPLMEALKGASFTDEDIDVLCEQAARI